MQVITELSLNKDSSNSGIFAWSGLTDRDSKSYEIFELLFNFSFELSIPVSLRWNEYPDSDSFNSFYSGLNILKFAPLIVLKILVTSASN